VSVLGRCPSYRGVCEERVDCILKLKPKLISQVLGGLMTTIGRLSVGRQKDGHGRLLEAGRWIFRTLMEGACLMEAQLWIDFCNKYFCAVEKKTLQKNFETNILTVLGFISWEVMGKLNSLRKVFLPARISEAMVLKTFSGLMTNWLNWSSFEFLCSSCHCLSKYQTCSAMSYNKYMYYECKQWL